MSKKDDFVDRVISFLRKVPSGHIAHAALHVASWELLEKDLRDEFGGREIYIRGRQKTQQAILRLFDGRNAGQVAARLGVSRSTVYRALRRG